MFLYYTDTFQTSGASCVGDWPESGGRVDLLVHSDLDDIFQIEKGLPDDSPVRRVNQIVVESGRSEGVNTCILVPPLICE